MTSSPTPTRARPTATTAAALAAATPPGRDRVVDLVRVAAMAVVVVGHWLLAAVTWGDDGLEGTNLLGPVEWARRLTWVFQVMPLVFVAGGAANAASWDSARGRGVAYADWLRGRLHRLVRPAAVLVGAWTAGLAVAHAAGADPEVLTAAARLVVMPLWFLAVYVPVVATTPVALAAHRRWGLRTAAVLVALVAATDAAVRAGLDAAGWAAYAWVWLLAHDLGFTWRERRPSPRRGWAVAAAGLAALAVLTTVGGYPVSMVSVPGGRANSDPPTLALVALAVAHVGVLCGLRPRLERLLERPAVWRAVVAGNGVVMTTYLWHMTALAAGVVVLLPTGWFPQPDPGSGGWWAWRPLWLAALLGLLAPLVALLRRVEAPSARPARRHRPRPTTTTTSATSATSTTSQPARTVAAAAIAAALAGGFVALSLSGVPVL